MLNDLKTSAIGLRRGWSVSRALSWAVCSRIKPGAWQLAVKFGCTGGSACAGSAVNAANPSSTRVNASSAGCNCLDPAPVHKSPADSTQPHSGCSNARGGRQKESQTIALVDVKPCALLNTVNAPRRMLGRGGDRPGEAVRGKHSKYMPGAGRDGGNIRLWNGSTCGACRRARTCVQRLARAPLAHAALADAHAKRQFPRTAVRS